MSPRITTFRDFWPYYISEHLHPVNRLLHFIGTTLVILCFVAALGFGRPTFFWLMPLAGYGFAWSGHFFVEKNRPATFRYPLYSLAADFVMYARIWSGRIHDDLRAARVHL